MDTVHGYIEIPKVFVENIIDTPMFQRLQHIDQTGMRVLYPSARHNRFIHSLGVYHLGILAVDALLENFSKQTYWNIYSDDSRYIFWAKNKVLFLLACLLHDIGHAPFSHSLESFFTANSSTDSYRQIQQYITDVSPTTPDWLRRCKPHEAVSALIVKEKFKDNIRHILCELGKKAYPAPIVQSFSEHAKPFPRLDDSAIDDDINFIARMIVGFPYEEFEPDRQIRNCFIQLLNGKNFDVDKLDYIIRDTRMSGIDNISIDVKRLLRSLTIVPKTEYRNSDIAEHNSIELTENSVEIISAFAYENIHIKGIVHGSIDVLNATVTLGANSRVSFENANIKSKTAAKLEGQSNVSRTGKSKIGPAGDGYIAFLASYEERYTMSPAIVADQFTFDISDGLTTLELQSDDVDITADQLFIKKSLTFKGTVNGKCSMTTLSKMDDSYCRPSEARYDSFSIGYNKQALNVIQNVMEARDYLYVWIYAHHKVVYYANFLVVELSRLALEILNIPQMNMLHMLIAYPTIIELNDVDLLSYIKQAKNKCDDLEQSRSTTSAHHDFLMLYNEFVSRKYKTSLYKSLAEYDIFFEKYDGEKRKKLLDRLCEITANKLESDTANETSADKKVEQKPAYGFWPREALNAPLEIFEALMWVNANYKRSTPDAHSIYICFKDKIVPLEKIPTLQKYSKNKLGQDEYFYIYYSLTEEGKNMQTDGNLSPTDIGERLRKYFKEIVYD